MTPPRAVFEAVRLPNEFRDRAPDCPDPDFCMTEMCGICDHCVKGWAERTATAVLAAFFAGEVEGPWHLCGITVPGVIGEPMWWDVNIPGDTTATRYRFSTESEARRVAHALNYTATEGV